MMLSALTLLAVVGAQPAPTWVWVEAEDAARTNFPPPERNPFAPTDAKQAELLSGGKWIGLEGRRSEPAFAEYELRVPAAGTYQLYARKFWKHGPYRWRIGTGPWQQVGPDVALMDEAPLRQFVVANWTHAGEVALKPGTHTLRVELTQSDGAAAFDAFLLTAGPFVARGKLKPGQKYNRTEPGFFPFEPDPDPFRPTPIDLRSLNEPRAGDGGFVAVRGEQFVHSKTGKPVRFWAINTGNDTLRLDRATLRNLARAWAKAGVNLVRVHGGPWGQDFRKVDPEHRDRLMLFVETLKREGIYTALSIYFPLWLRFDERSGFAGYTGGRHPFALLFFNTEFQSIYRGWWRDLLTAKSPYSGLTLAQDPAVAMLEMVNEDSILFWTFTPYENIPGPQMAVLEKQFGDWLAKRYGGVGQALAAWGGQPIRGDDAGAGRAGFMPLWEVFNKRDRRARDTAEFLTKLQREFFASTQRYLKTDLGFRSTITGSNWITADARILGPLDKWSNTVADFMDQHGYFDVGHSGERASYSVSVGDTYEDRSALRFLPNKPGERPNFALPIFTVRYDGKPSTLSEVNWTPPNALRADFPVVAAAYGSLQGLDSVMFFATGSAWWDETVLKFGLRTPVIFGQFPATAILYRKGLLKEGPTVVEANLDLSKLFALEGAPGSAPASLDQLRAGDVPSQASPVDRLQAFDPLAFLVGKVDFRFVDAPRPSKIAQLGRFIDHQAKRVRSATGELLWDYGQGLVEVRSPMAVGLTGYLKGRVLRTSALDLEPTMEYGSILAVSLDGQPLAKSAKILVQVASQEQPYGWRTSGSQPKRIESLGLPPMLVRRFEGQVRLKRPDAGKLRISALDFNGYPKKRLPAGPILRLEPDVLYYVIEAPASPGRARS